MQNEKGESKQIGVQVGSTSHVNMSPKLHDKCSLLDWCGDEIVAEGRWCSSDPTEFVNHTPLGPNAMKVMVDILYKPEAFLWRPTTDIFCMQQALGKAIAWPTDKSEQMNPIKCTMFDWTGKEEIVAIGCWVSNDPKMLVDGIPLGPNAMIIWVDIHKSPEAFLWRPTPDMTNIKDDVGCKVAWPADKVCLGNSSINKEQAANTPSSPSSVNDKSKKKKCNLLDFTGSGKIVAEGHWSSSDPKELVHFVPLGPNVVRIWVDIARIRDASLWRPTSELDCIEDAVGTTVAWPSDKVIFI